MDADTGSRGCSLQLAGKVSTPYFAGQRLGVVWAPYCPQYMLWDRWGAWSAGMLGMHSTAYLWLSKGVVTMSHSLFQ